MFKQKCIVHPTLIKAATGGKIIAKIVNKLKKINIKLKQFH